MFFPEVPVGFYLQLSHVGRQILHKALKPLDIAGMARLFETNGTAGALEHAHTIHATFGSGLCIELR